MARSTRRHVRSGLVLRVLHDFPYSGTIVPPDYGTREAPPCSRRPLQDGGARDRDGVSLHGHARSDVL